MRKFLFSFLVIVLMATSAQSNTISDNLINDGDPHLAIQVLRFSACSNGPIKFIPLNEKFEEFVIVANHLDLECFEKMNLNFSKTKEKQVKKKYDSDVEFAWEKSKNGNLRYQISNILSPIYLSCGEKCRFSEEPLIKISENYYFISYRSDWGIEAELINEKIILFKANNVTHQLNLTFNIEHENLMMLPSGDIEFYQDYVLVLGQKSYLKNVGGAFWYDSKIDYKGNLLELLDKNNGACISRDKFYERIEKFLIANGKLKFCVSR